MTGCLHGGTQAGAMWQVRGKWKVPDAAAEAVAVAVVAPAGALVALA